ncbi:sigma-54-dependent transcriptional regulator [Shouchella shacheensis]|uniref:sigma-54-dependent transcriptional regulator n=1 Tax=Shouchella shacheensis TaxID=1649580 RepID=UPI0007401904|nr:sigma-54 dependent transcriptional regulator [Shouchella shacheensis]
MKTVLIIDDEPSICAALTFALEDDYNVYSTTDPDEGLSLISERIVHVCVLDLRIGQRSGLDVLEEIKSRSSKTAVVMATAYGTIETSVKALQNGAYSYITKPVNTEELLSVLSKAIEYTDLNEKVEYLSQELERSYHLKGMVGSSQAMRQLFHLIEKVTNVDTSILVTGESGTGKELVARAIHFSGKRKKHPFEVVNCAAIPEQLLESELFGYQKGAFSGATSAKAGKFQLANEGTIFLDEIGDMPLSLQAKLLRVLQQKEVTPLGSNRTEQLNVRVIAATNKDLQQACVKGEFREDLYFRLNVIQLEVPPLRERKDDLPLLFRYFLEQFNEELQTNVRGFSKQAEQFLLHYEYPGNIRELSNMIEAAMVMSDGEAIELHHLPRYLQDHQVLAPISRSQAAHAFVGATMKQVEKEVILASLDSLGGHRKNTAAMLGMSERSLRDKLKTYEQES